MLSRAALHAAWPNLLSYTHELPILLGLYTAIARSTSTSAVHHPPTAEVPGCRVV